jgi:hypothetical protein
MVEGVVAFYLHLAGTMEDQFLILHRHFPLPDGGNQSRVPQPPGIHLHLSAGHL